MVSLKCPRNSWGTLQMPLINCEIDYILHWSVNCVMSPNNNAYQEKTLAMTDTGSQIYQNNWIQVLKEQLTGKNINREYQCQDKKNI